MNKPASVPEQFDAVVVGAGFSGLYMLYRLRQLGLSVKVFDSAGDVGGTWYWNRYPGARCDVPTTDYAYSFDPELEKEWTWSEKYATQPEILDYLRFVADRYGLRSDIEFSATVTSARWDEPENRWRITTGRGEEIRCRYYIMATGCLSMPKSPDIEGAGRFAGQVYFTSRWPHEGADFTGQRVAVIGTGSSGIQCIPLIARQASQLTVFQRTPNFSIPAHNGPAPADTLEQLAEDRDGYRHSARWSRGGILVEPTDVRGVTASEAVRRERFEAAWDQGALFGILNVFADQGVNPASNDIVAEMIREKIRSIVKDPGTAEALCPKDHYFGTKRPCLDTGYFETYNLPHVRLVDLRKQPIVSITEDGIETADESFGFDAIVYATGFDAMTGALEAADVTGRDGLSLTEKWAAGPSTYLGLMTAGFPNFFMLTGPGSPSVLSNMTVSIEQHVDWVAGCLQDMHDEGLETIEPTALAESGWNQHVQDCAAITLYPTANSWYMGANVPGKPRVFLPYIGGVNAYRQACDDVVEQGYLGFTMTGPAGARCRDGVIRSMQPDVAMILELVAAMGLPPMDTLSAADARAMMAATAASPPAGSRGGRGHRRSDPRAGRGPAVPAVPPSGAIREPAPPGGVLPRRWLGARQPGFGRPALPGPVRAFGRGGRVGELPPRPRGSLSRRRAGRLRGRAVGERQRHRARRHPRSARRRRLERGGQYRRGRVPAGPRRRRPAHLRAGADMPGRGLGHDRAVLPGKRRRVCPHHGADEVVLGSLCRSSRPRRPPRRPAARRPARSAPDLHRRCGL